MTLTATDAELERLERAVGTPSGALRPEGRARRGVDARGRRVRTGGGPPPGGPGQAPDGARATGAAPGASSSGGQ